MNSITDRVTGVNTWFIIEILSFYGYIFSAVLFILQHSCKSSWGWKNKTDEVADLHKYDFVAFYRKDLDWAAFV